MKLRFIEAGEIVNTHGIRGELKVKPWADSPEFLCGFKIVYIDGLPHRVRASRVHNTNLILSLDAVDDVNTAMRLKGKTLFIDREDTALADGEFFLQDIIGAQVVTEDGAELGRLADVLELPASNVYVVRGEREILIPAVPEFILHTDIDRGRVTVRLIDGM